MSRVVLRTDATLDIRAAALWYEDQDAGLGDVFIAQVDATLKKIADLPARYPFIDAPLRRALLHQFPYTIGFITEPSRVVVIGVFHQHRDPTVWRERLAASTTE